MCRGFRPYFAFLLLTKRRPSEMCRHFRPYFCLLPFYFFLLRSAGQVKCGGTSVPTFAFCLFTFYFLESEPPYVNARSRREGSDSVLNCACSRRSHRPFRLCGPDRRLKMAQTSLAPDNPALRMVAPREHQQASQASGETKCTVRATKAQAQTRSH
jgi:hypothetical protein